MQPVALCKPMLPFRFPTFGHWAFQFARNYRSVYMLKREGREVDDLFALLERGVIRVSLQVEEQQADLRAHLHRYRDRPVSLADGRIW
jgi:hypothetical protein